MTAVDLDSFLHIDVARILADEHAPRGNGMACACEDNPDGGTWTNDQPTWAAHATVELARAGHLRDDELHANLLNQIARQDGQIERLRIDLATARGIKPFHPQETTT